MSQGDPVVPSSPMLARFRAELERLRDGGVSFDRAVLAANYVMLKRYGSGWHADWRPAFEATIDAWRCAYDRAPGPAAAVLVVLAERAHDVNDVPVGTSPMT